MTNFRKMIRGYYVLINRARFPQNRKFKFNREMLIYPFRLLVHPIDGFTDLKYEGRSSLLIANVLMVLYIFQRLLSASETGYLFNTKQESLNLLIIAGQIVSLLLLWTICNWAMCTLTEGEGKLSEIWIVICYALLPSILFGFIQILISHTLSLDEHAIYAVFHTIGTGWTLLLAFLGMMVVHQYSVSKTMLSVIYTGVCIVIVLFLLLLFFTISQQLFGFIIGLAQEISYR